MEEKKKVESISALLSGDHRPICKIKGFSSCEFYMPFSI
jgi:hypothetical protein